MPGVLATQPVSGIGNVYCQPPTCYCLAHQQPGDPGTDAGKANPDNTSESAFTPATTARLGLRSALLKKRRALASLNPGLLQHNAHGHPEAKPGAAGVTFNGGRTVDASRSKTGAAVVSADMSEAAGNEPGHSDERINSPATTSPIEAKWPDSREPHRKRHASHLLHFAIQFVPRRR